MREKEKINYVLIKDFNTFVYDHSMLRKKKHFCCYCLHAFNTEEILKLHIKDWFKINRNLRILMPKKVNMLHLKIIEEKSHCL